MLLLEEADIDSVAPGQVLSRGTLRPAMEVTSDRITGGFATLQSSSRLLNHGKTQRVPERRVNIFELR
jgi:hypothetical protein